MDQYFEALEKSKNSIALNIVEQMGFDETVDVLEKGHAAQMGEIRTWNNIKYQKTPNGWVLVKGEQKSEKKEEKNSSIDSIKLLANKLEEWGFPIHGSSMNKTKTGRRLRVTFPVDQSWIPGSDTYEKLESKMKSVLNKHREELDKMGVQYKIDMVSGGRGTIDIACYFRVKENSENDND